MPEDEVVSQFRTEVIERFAARDKTGTEHNYENYLATSLSERTGDEANAVDIAFAQKVFAWLGYEDSATTYNRPEVGKGKNVNRPDFRVHASVGTAFIWESKSTSEDWNEREHSQQLRRYVAGTSGYAVWCNARRLLALRFDPNGQYSILAEVDIEGLFGPQRVMPVLESEITNALGLFYLLFRQTRFNEFDALLQKVCVDEETFAANARPLNDEQSQREFVRGSVQVLGHLKMAALSRAQVGVQARRRLDDKLSEWQRRWRDAANELLARFPIQGRLGEVQVTPFQAAHAEVKSHLERASAHLGDVSSGELDEVQKLLNGRELRLSPEVKRALGNWRINAERINAAAAADRFYAGSAASVTDAFSLWADRQTDSDLATLEVFAEQAAYVFFVRVLLARMLEDKGILEHRIVSDGGFTAWRDLVQFYADGGPLNIHTQPFVYMLSARVSRYYQHFFQQPVFDWFIPDDLLLVETLEFLGRYNFSQVNSDLLGFTYENYTERIARNKKGHFLTQPRVVEYMLDLAEYKGSSIIGAKMLDPACGSGSFLVGAARRYRTALENYNQQNGGDRVELARQYVAALTTIFHGLEINPFSCYLAELNLLVCGLEDIHVLWQAGEFVPIERFRVYDTNSLDLPRPTLSSTIIGSRSIQVPFSPEDAALDETYSLKARLNEYSTGFAFIFSNPPYISPKQQRFERNYRESQFFAEALSGDANMYLLFLRLGVHYVGFGGKMCFIIPLTVLGDAASGAMRSLMTRHDLHPRAIVRFFTGNALFEGVDQATAILVVEQNEQNAPDILVGGGKDVSDARLSHHVEPAARVLSSTPNETVGWTAPWLVATEPQAYDVWEKVMQGRKGFLRDLWQDVLEPSQGDVNSTHLNPFRVGNAARQTDDVAIYKGENIARFAPLPQTPADSARQREGQAATVNAKLRRLCELQSEEKGFVFREVARLNTRECLSATWFERSRVHRLAFTHEAWRFRLLPNASEERALALLSFINSRIVAYLLNLFSTNNHVLLGELGRILIPDVATFPQAELAAQSSTLLAQRAALETDFVEALGAVLPSRDDIGEVKISPQLVLTQSQLPPLRLEHWQQRGVFHLPDNASKVGTILDRNTLHFAAELADEVEEVARLFLGTQREKRWSETADLMLPEPNAAARFLKLFAARQSESQAAWDNFVVEQRAIDDIVARWYGFDEQMLQAIRGGLPWARRG